MSTAYFNSSGRLIALVKESEELTPPESAVASAVVPDATLANDLYYSFADDEVKTKTALAPVIARNRVTGLPVGTMAHFDGTSVTITDGALIFDTDVEEEIAVYLIHEHYKPLVVKVQAGP